MITQQDITKLKKVFVTKAEMNARFDQVDRKFAQVDRRFDKMDQRFNKIESNAEEQTNSLASTLTELINEVHLLKVEQQKLSKLFPIMYKTLTNHETRITGLEAKILLS